MRRKIIIGLAVYAVVFSIASAYVIHVIGNATGNLNRLITLHQVEILREHYMLQIRKVQSDLLLENTENSRGFDNVIRDVKSMGGVIETCFGCHHSPRGMERLKDLKSQTERYKDSLSRVFTLRANAGRRAAEEDAAFHTGEELIAMVGEMISFTTSRLEENTGKEMDRIDRSKYILYGLVVLGPLVSVALGFILLTGMTRPVKILVASTRQLKSGDLDHRVVGLSDEFGELAAAFNEMAGSLKEQIHKMQRAEQMVVVGELAAGLAHEIKNPMAGIKVAMSVLSDESYITPEDKAVLQKVVAEITQLEGLMKNFLNFTKPRKPRLEPVNVNQVLSTTLTFHLKYNALAPGEAGKIQINKDLRELPSIMADPTQLQQVFLNLFLNALHAMPRGGELGVRTCVEAGGKMIRIEISDTGSGIREDLLTKVFQPFFTTKPKGTGLGLAISRQMIEQHNGTIAVANRSGGGALFTILLPVKVEGEAA